MSEMSGAKLLFCFLNNKVSGGNRILLELANRSLKAGLSAELLFLDRSRDISWFQNGCKIVEENIDDHIDLLANYDFVFAPNASAVPTLFPYCNNNNNNSNKNNKLVLISQGYEPYCFGQTIIELFSPKESIENILRIDFPIIATSRSIQSLLKDRIGRSSYLVPVAVDRSCFPHSETASLSTSSNSPTSPTLPRRVLAVGDFRARFKGIFDIADALEVLSKHIPVELVLLTQQKSGRDAFKNYSFPVEFHCDPPQEELAKIYASCHAYCCASWYEGFGLPCLESFSIGLPVVATRNLGVEEFAKTGENILLARPHSPDDLAAQLQTILTDENLRKQLIEGGTTIAEQYNWHRTMDLFFDALNQIKNTQPASVRPTDDQLQGMLDDLESNGFYTPRKIEFQLKWISGELQALCSDIKNGEIDPAKSKQTLEEIKLQLRRHLQNPATNYYKEFKARFDLCQMLSIMDDPKDWLTLLNRG